MCGPGRIGLAHNAEQLFSIPSSLLSEPLNLNHGSTGQPRDGDPRACYAVLEDHQVTWHRVAYDYRITQKKILDTGVLSEVLARRLAIGK